jgi:hypothetical protein
MGADGAQIGQNNAPHCANETEERGTSIVGSGES